MLLIQIFLLPTPQRDDKQPYGVYQKTLEMGYPITFMTIPLIKSKHMAQVLGSNLLQIKNLL